VASRWKANYHYERLFGYEISKCESFKHPEMLGLDPSAPTHKGWVRGGLLRKYRSPQGLIAEEDRRVWSLSTPWREKHDTKEFHLLRQEAKKKRNIIKYTEFDEYLHPEMEEDYSVLQSKPDFFLGKYQLPRWADLQNVIFEHLSCGRTTQGRYPKRAAFYMLQYLHSNNPIESWIRGGYKINSYFYRDPGVSLQNQLLYNSLKLTEISPWTTINKVEGEGALAHIVKGSGIDFLKNAEESFDDSPLTVETLELADEDISVSYADSDEEELCDLEEGIDIDYASDTDDDEIVVSDNWE
jgi:hypothetical protein